MSERILCLLSTHSRLCFWFCHPPLILAFNTLCLLSPVQGEEAAALGAGLGEGSAVGGKGAFWVIAAAIEGALLFTHSLY